MPEIHVVPDGDGWAVEAENVSVPYATEEAAIAAGRSAALNRHCGLVIHGVDGSLRAASRAGTGTGSSST